MQNCFKEYEEENNKCQSCKVKQSCKREHGKIIKKQQDWNYTKYRSALEKKFKLEEENMQLYQNRLKLKSEMLSIDNKRAKNEKEIFNLNNEARHHMGYGMVKSEKEIEVEVENENKNNL